MDKSTRTRRGFVGLLLAAALLPVAEARGKRSGGGSRSRSGGGSGLAGGSRGGCGSRGGAGYRKANGKCAGRNE